MTSLTVLVSSMLGLQVSLAIFGLYPNSFPKSHFLGTTAQNGEVSSYLHNLII